MTADVLSKRRDDQVSTMCQRGLIDRSQHRIVDDDNRPLAARTGQGRHRRTCYLSPAPAAPPPQSALSLAHLHAAPMIVVFRLAPEGSRLVTAHDQLVKWWDRVSLRPSFLRTQTPRQPRL